MVSVGEALKIVLSNIGSVGVERVTIRQAMGRILAEPIVCLHDIPSFDNSAMDGFAVRACDLKGASKDRPVRLRVVETIGAGNVPTHRILPGTAARIMTGALLPDGADAVVPVEQSRAVSDDVVEIFVEAQPGACVRRRGEDIRAGQKVLDQGRKLRAADIGLLASLGRAVVDVHRRPRVAIVCTGDELVDLDQEPVGAQVRNSNAYSLAAAVEESGGEPVVLPIARDSIPEIKARFEQSLASDAVVTTGGVSVGQFDLVKEALRQMGMRELFHGVAQRPGKPMMFGLLREKPIFSLPGNPVSALVCFAVYLRPALEKLAGCVDITLPRIRATCAVQMKSAKGLTEFIRVKIERRNGAFYVEPSGAQSSGILSSMTRANGLLISPPETTLLEPGAQVDVLVLTPESVLDEDASFEA